MTNSGENVIYPKEMLLDRIQYVLKANENTIILSLTLFWYLY